MESNTTMRRVSLEIRRDLANAQRHVVLSLSHWAARTGLVAWWHDSLQTKP